MENSDQNQTASTPLSTPKLGRNDPCHCGSGKKYKKCHGLTDSVVTATPAMPSNAMANSADANAAAMAGAGFDPNSFDPAMMAQVSQMLSRMPKGQLLKMQALMSKAMSGKDISKEAGAFEKTLPVELQQLLLNMPQSTVDAASSVVPGIGEAAEEKKESRFSKIWGNLTKKK